MISTVFILKNIQEFVYKSKTIDVNVDGIVKCFENCDSVLHILTRGDLNRIDKQTNNTVVRWSMNRGLELGEKFTDTVRNKLYFQWYTRFFLDAVVKNICNFYKITGVEVLKYYNVARNVWHLFNTETIYTVISKLVNLYNSIVSKSKTVEEYDDEILKVVFIASIQAIVYCRRKFGV